MQLRMGIILIMRTIIIRIHGVENENHLRL